ncbi:MAG: transaldolase [Dehalococcoidia bacterium]|nr:transaldolase [Dehalococcoidia bacterium]
MDNPVQRAQHLGQSIWYDNMRRGLLSSGELERLIDLGVTGLTSNPTIFEKAVAGSSDYDNALLALALAGASSEEAYEAIVLDDIGAAADLLLPVYQRTRGRDGYASLEVSPALARDADSTIAEAQRLFSALGRPNVMIKVPGTPEGIPAVRRLIGAGININVTLIFSLEAYAEVREAYLAGLEDFRGQGGDVSRVASVASFFVSRVDTAVDAALEKAVAGGHVNLRGLLGQAAVANARLAYQAFRENYATPRAQALLTLGARPQRPLWASTGTKNPTYSDVLYVDSLVGDDTVNTMPPPTLAAFLEHGVAQPVLKARDPDAAQIIQEIESAGIRMQQVTDRLLAEGVKAFADSFDSLLANIERKMAALLRRPRFSAPSPSLEAALQSLDRSNLVQRIWQSDHTVWSPESTEIADRLGWLRAPESMAKDIPAVESFGQEIRSAGFEHVVLLGMGGSSLGPEVLRRSFGSAAGYPELIVLDSTIPSAVDAVDRLIDPKRTLFLLSSKSGTTIEPLSLYKHFRTAVASAVGDSEAGKHFAAITDPGTPLQSMARDQGFRSIFLNPPDIGGRYSALSLFGLVPAALIGVDSELLLARARLAAEECGPKVAAGNNPGAWLGALMASMAKSGKDKLTIVTSPGIDGFGLWIEQLIAESLGKGGRGIVPVTGEPLLAPEHYGQDRLFAHLRLTGEDNAAQDAAMSLLEAAGHPVVRIDLRDRYDLGSEFFRWELAASVAGSLLGVHPFDQPDVQLAKDLTGRMLKEGVAGALGAEAAGALPDLVASVRTGDYFSVLAYVTETPEMNEAFAGLRQSIMERCRVATTVGYGPRYLHSTGQLHKGGPNSGVFLVITADQSRKVSVPGERFSFNTLAQAQALGDLRALRDRGRRVLHLHLASEDPLVVKNLAQEASTPAMGVR